MREIGRLVLVLGLICSLSGASLSFVRTKLAGRIEQQSDLFVRGPALARLFQKPAEELLANKITLQDGGRTYPVFYALQDGQVSGLAVEAPGHGGYGGDIVIMVGVDMIGQKLSGVEIVSHAETPGVGSQVEAAGFRGQWHGLSLDQPAALRTAGGQVDAITGATFSSRAMIDGTNQVVDLIRERRDEILATIAGR